MSSQQPPDAENPGDVHPADLDALLQAIGGALPSSLDDIEEPTAAELAEMESQEDLEDDLPLLPLAVLEPRAVQPKPDLVSLESLDEADLDEPALDDELDPVPAAIAASDEPPSNYIDVDLDESALDDGGYELDDDDVDFASEDADSSYHKLYGDDDVIIPSFREGEFAIEEDADSAYYDDLR